MNDLYSMSSVNLVVIVESIRSFMSHEKDNVFHLASILAVAAALGNFILSPFLLNL